VLRFRCNPNSELSGRVGGGKQALSHRLSRVTRQRRKQPLTQVSTPHQGSRPHTRLPLQRGCPPPTRLPLQRELSAKPIEGAARRPLPAGSHLPTGCRPPHKAPSSEGLSVPPSKAPSSEGLPAPPQGSLFRGSCRRSRLRVPPAPPLPSHAPRLRPTQKQAVHPHTG